MSTLLKVNSLNSTNIFKILSVPISNIKYVNKEKLSLIISTGSILTFSSNSLPEGFLECDGSAISRNTYSKLFNIIGTRWGYGNNSTTFNIPDLRGSFIRSWSNSSDIDPDKNTRTQSKDGGVNGNNVGSYQTDEFFEHYNLIYGTIENTTFGTVNSYFGGTVTLNDTGGNETRPLNCYIGYVIKY